MRRLLTVLMMLTLAFTSGAVIESAICEHQDARAHVIARDSGVSQVALVALGEETAAKAASLQGQLADASGNLLAGYILPQEAVSPPRRTPDEIGRRLDNSAELAGRSVLPLLQPPRG